MEQELKTPLSKKRQGELKAAYTQPVYVDGRVRELGAVIIEIKQEIRELKILYHGLTQKLDYIYGDQNDHED